jgi:hypothetical protein
VRSSPTPDAWSLWYELGGLYAAAGEDARRTSMLGFAVGTSVAALVLLSAPLFGTAWAGPLAPAIPILAGLLGGGGSFLWRRLRFFERRNALKRALAKKWEDADRPTAGGLGAYYDAQLILLRSEYEFVRSRGTKRALHSARLLEASFGFTPEDGFECGPLNVAPDAPEMRALREHWEARLAARRALEVSPPPLGLREDAHYRVFPREMTVRAELATRSAYLRVSCGMIRDRYGRNPHEEAASISEELGRRVKRDLKEYAAISGRRAR